MAVKKTGRRVRLTRRVTTLADEIAAAEVVQQAKPKQQQPKQQQQRTNWDSPMLRREKLRPNFVSADDVHNVYDDGTNYWDWN